MGTENRAVPFRLNCRDGEVYLRPDQVRAGAELDRGFERQLIFNAKDEAIFGEALKESFPTLRFIQFGETVERTIAFVDSLGPPIDFQTTVIVLPYSEPWESRIELIRPDSRGRKGRYNLLNMPGRWLGYRSTRWCWPPRSRPDADWSFDWPVLGDDFLGNGLIWGRHSSQDPAKNLIRAFYRKVSRIICRISTKKCADAPASYDVKSAGSSANIARSATATERLGHCALEWARAGDERRMLNSVYRPADDWEVPNDPWYQRLKAEVEAQYGMDFGLPPTEQPGGGALPALTCTGTAAVDRTHGPS